MRDNKYVPGTAGKPPVTQTPTAKAILAETDEHGPPYVIPAWSHGERVSINYGMVLEIALSAHPSRVLANTNGYRYGKFTFPGTGAVDVHMMGSHIATFRPDSVQLWSRGYVTVSTTEALGNLCDSAWFYAVKHKIIVRLYTSNPRDAHEFTEGETFPYREESK